jgi:hypothetical protein
MQVHELVEVGRFLNKFIQTNDLPGLYQALIDAVQQAAQNQNPQEVGKSLDNLRRLHQQAEEQVMSPALTRPTIFKRVGLVDAGC